MEKLVRNLVTNSLQQSTKSYRLVFGSKILFPGEYFQSVLHFKKVWSYDLLLKPNQTPTPSCLLHLSRDRGWRELFFSVDKINTGFPFIIFFNDITLQTKNLAKDFFFFLYCLFQLYNFHCWVPQSGYPKL